MRIVSPSGAWTASLRLALICTAISTIGLAGCDDEGFDVTTQIGANPVLPEPQQYLLPPMKIAKTTSWGHETPTVAPGLHVEAFATGLGHPRSLYVLPNGDVLVAEANGPPAPVSRPKELIMGWVQSLAGAKAKGANQITLFRNVKDGKAETRSVFLENLNSPFGVALVGSDLYVANTDAIMKFPYHDGDTKISAPGVKLADLPGGPIDHHWTKSLVASADGSKLYAGVGSNSNITENGCRPNSNGRRFEKLTARPAPTACSRPACAIPTACSGSRKLKSCGRWLTNVTNSVPIWCRTI
jgi:glucose/arabinose dehydrogenase